MTNAAAPDELDPFEGVHTQPHGVTGKPGKVMLLGLAGFMAWALLFPLGSAVIAPATLIASGQNHKLQHLSGGTIADVYAAEGDLVGQDAPVMALDPALDQARLTKLRARYAVLNALRTRLQAEAATGATGIRTDAIANSFFLRGTQPEPAALRQEEEGRPIEALLNAEQRRQFETGRQAVDAQLRGLEERAAGQRKRLAGLRSQVSDSERRVEIVKTQLAKAKSLVEAGYLASQQVWDLETRLLDADRVLTDLRSEIATAEGAVGETEAEISRLKLADSRDTSQQLTDVLAEIGQITDELAAAEQARAQTVLRSPIRGYLVHLEARTAGEVVKPGQTVAEIVPADAPLAVKARIPLNQIGHVAKGQQAEVKISALNPRLFDAIPAEVSYVAADATLDERTGERYFEARALLDQQAVRESGAVLTPGMGGEIFIKGAQRTFATYMLQPFLDGLSRTFREVH